MVAGFACLRRDREDGLQVTVASAPFAPTADPSSDVTLPDIFGLETVQPDLGVLAEEFDPTPNPHLTDPVGWVREKEFVWSVQASILDSLVDNRYTAVPSAHGPGKSWSAARAAAWWLDVHPEGEAFVVTTAPTWAQVKAILWREIRAAKRKRGLPGRTTLNCEWYLGGSRIGDEDEMLVAYGRKPADYDQAAFQGIHARYVLVIVDEASGVPRLLFEAIDSIVTNIHARVLAVGNPDDPASEFAKICRPGSGWNVIPVSAFDTPAFTGEEVPEALLEMLPSREWVEERKRRWGEGSPIYQSKVLGQFPDIGEDTLVGPKLIRQAQALDLSGEAIADPGQWGWDVARYGSDKTVGYLNRGGVIRKEYESAKTSTMETAGQIKRRLKPRVGSTPAVIDVIGVGAGVVDRLREQRVKGIVPFNASNAAHEPERFVNRRAEIYWHFREDLEAGLIDLPPEGEDDDLIAQLGAIKWSVDSRGRVKVESKDDMKKRGLPSPDHLDAAVYSSVRGARSRTLPNAELAKSEQHDNTMTGDLLTREM